MTDERPDQAGPRPLDRLDRIQTIEDRAVAAIEALDKAITPRTTPERSPTTPLKIAIANAYAAADKAAAKKLKKKTLASSPMRITPTSAADPRS